MDIFGREKKLFLWIYLEHLTHVMRQILTAGNKTIFRVMYARHNLDYDRRCREAMNVNGKTQELEAFVCPLKQAIPVVYS